MWHRKSLIGMKRQQRRKNIHPASEKNSSMVVFHIKLKMCIYFPLISLVSPENLSVWLMNLPRGEGAGAGGFGVGQGRIKHWQLKGCLEYRDWVKFYSLTCVSPGLLADTLPASCLLSHFLPWAACQRNRKISSHYLPQTPGLGEPS